MSDLVFFFASSFLERILAYFLVGSSRLPFRVGILYDGNVLYLGFSGLRIVPLSKLRNYQIGHVNFPDDSLRAQVYEYALRFRNSRYSFRTFILAGLSFFLPSKRLASLVKCDVYHNSAWIAHIYRIFCCDLCPDSGILTTPTDLYFSPLVELPE